MSYQPGSDLWPDALRPHLAMYYSQWSRGLHANAPTSNAWSSANRAIYIPIHIAVTTVARRLWLAVGTTGGTNSVDMGIYDSAGNRLVSDGGHTVGTASQVQFLNITDTTLQPGAYYIGIAYNGTTAHIMTHNAPNTDEARLVGILQQATAYTLPNPATFATLGTTLIPICGIATTASP